MKICRSCGADNPDDMNFCSNCGNELDNNYDTSSYDTPPRSDTQFDPTLEVTPDNYNVLSILALVFGCLGFFINPLYVISIVAIILGIIGHVKSIYYKKRAMIGWILGVASLVFQIIFDLVCTWGLGIFC